MDEARVEVRELCWSEPEPVEDTGTEGVHEHVRGPDQNPRGRQALGVLQIERHRSLAAAQRDEQAALPRGRVRRERAKPVASSGILELDHVGAEPDEQRGRVGTGKQPGEVHDPHTRERRRSGRCGTRPLGVPAQGLGRCSVHQIVVAHHVDPQVVVGAVTGRPRRRSCGICDPTAARLPHPVGPPA